MITINKLLTFYIDMDLVENIENIFLFLILLFKKLEKY